MTERERACIKFFDVEKGWGFVTRGAGKPDAFLHRSVLAKTNVDANDLDEMRAVDVVVVEGKPGKGPQVDSLTLA